MFEKKEDIEKLKKFLTLKQVDVMEVFDRHIGSLPDQERAVIENNIENPIDQTDFKNLKERKILRKFESLFFSLILAVFSCPT